MEKADVAAALREIASRLDALGENRFRARAYARGARSLESSEADLGALIAERALTTIPGIGEALARVIEELARTGTSRLLERLRTEVPASVLELARIRGLGLERARRLHDALGVSTVPELEAACRQRRVREVKGFGPATEARLLEAIARHHARAERFRSVDVVEEVESVRARLAGHADEVELGGALARHEDSATTLVFAALARDPGAVLDRLASWGAVARVESRREGVLAVRLASGRPVELLAAGPETWPATLLRATASDDHLERLRRLARCQHIDNAVDILEFGAPGRIATVEALYAILGLPPLAVELRDGPESIEAALAGDDFADLVRREDLRGAVHCHTLWSDGADTVEDMARAAASRGLEYVTITDHSPAAHYAGGLDRGRLKKQWAEIARVQRRVAIRIVRGVEADILPDGAIDVHDDDLARLDLVIASIHARNGMDEERMTRRLVRAIEQPPFKLWGHPLGRLVLRRPPVDCRVGEVLDAVSRSRAAIEVNGDPYRLDLEPRWIREARRRGARFVISSDAHSTGGLAAVESGIGIARRGWVRRGEVLNALPADAFLEAVRPLARRAA